ncbi:group II truncated hemoglobin [Xenorhabdus hominickii]|uniref:Oxidoreductase n=1 Tax=Xenorhabdus hominickii TaxID=351679 RepID=A0A2G0QD10_XENHO|nr:group II truncated hemoglobin [Xenorhabdus hominickii]AOM41238.1 oxidoreductase [Xenorhabdus hominickii]PHM55510.1 oxidoreductase [Xenorhabdus hominickii]PHM57125.1 oxidoreductase [Xenorhabdus hominickii]
MTNKTPTLFEWMGGREALMKLMTVFYDKVEKDELLAPLFKNMKSDHPAHVAMWLEEVLGGEERYTNERGGFKVMLSRHRGRSIQPEQRKRWVELLMLAADEIGLPSDPEFRAAFSGYIEWGSRRAEANSQPDATPSRRETVPKWDWGAAPPGTP